MAKACKGDHSGNSATLATNGTLPVIIIDNLNADGTKQKKTGITG